MIINCPTCRCGIDVQSNSPPFYCPNCSNVVDPNSLKLQPGMAMPPTPNVLGGGMDVNKAFYTVSQNSPQISCSKLEQAMKLLGYNISPDVCNQLTIKHDRDRSGMLDVNEFALIVSEVNQWRDAFCFFDSDHSGRLDFQEFSNALLRIGYRFPPQLVTLIFTNLDSNRAGYLDLDAFIKACSVVQVVIMKMQQYDPQRRGIITVDLNQMLDIVFSIPM